MSINILDELKTDFLVYSQEVNNNRAFADARDGLKISQRAVLWEMFDKKYSSNKPHVKSAKVDGGVIANWHPHGSEYPTIVRMSQDWVNNIPEISFHGANGSLIGGPEAAASRYTECRLSESSEDGFFSNIAKDVVDFKLNYSEDEKWPTVFPAINPRLFVNGSQGIGYTIAQEWEPGNLKEFQTKLIEYISTGKVSCDNIYPDYPTGGIIINKSDIHNIYETGKGSIIIRAKTNIIDNIIQITELPYQVYAEPLIQKIKDLTNNELLTGVDDVCNKSDDNGLLIEIECSKPAEVVLSQLFKLTELQSTFNANQMALVDGIPKLLNLEEYIQVYLDHNISCLQREYQFDLNKAQARLEIVTGLLKAIGIIDDVIKAIKSATSIENAKDILIHKFMFTDNQAKAIVDMRLGKLANLEQKNLQDEMNDLNKIITKCEKLLASKKAQEKEFLKRLNDFVNKYGWKRRTQVTDIDISVEKEALKANQRTTEDAFIIVLTKGNNIKRMYESDYKPSRKIFSDSDQVVNAIKVSSKDKFILISSDGLMYKLQVNKIALCNNMNASGTSLIDMLGTTIVNIFAGTESNSYLFFVTKNGLVKKINCSDVFNISKNVGTSVMKVDNNDYIIDCQGVDENDILNYALGKRKVVFNVSKFNVKSRFAGGVIGVRIKDNRILEKISQ